jgi:uncharacterized iron-regulated protein
MHNTMKTTISRHILPALLWCLCTVSSLRADALEGCLEPGQWARPTSNGATIATVAEVMAAAREADIVLLGEAHDNADHHLWQLQALSMLHGQHDDMIIGMEMFPRRVQPVLDRWIAGQLSEAQLLKQSDWDRVWRFDAELYLPILRFARLNKLRLVALNVERSLIAETGAGGWEAVAVDRREGISDPAAAPDAYRESLRSSFYMHAGQGQGSEQSGSASATPDDSAFEYFLQAQLVWDRAFAQGLAEARTANPEALVVGIIGSGHLRYRHGVPYQLRTMGVQRSLVWMPVGVASQCAEIAEIADAVFAVAGSQRNPTPRLGVYLRDTDDGTEIGDVVAGSVAATAGLRAGDRVLGAAGTLINSSGDLIAIVRKQSPGTWLPMTIARDGETIEVVARFPASTKNDLPSANNATGTRADE